MTTHGRCWIGRSEAVGDVTPTYAVCCNDASPWFGLRCDPMRKAAACPEASGHSPGLRRC